MPRRSLRSPADETGGLCFKRGSDSFANYWGKRVNFRRKSTTARFFLLLSGLAVHFASLDARIALANQRIVSFEKLCHQHGITELASYDIEPLAIEAKVFSMLGRRLLELIGKVDQLMPMLATLCIDEALSTSQLISEKSQIKKTVRAATATTRALSLGLLKRINALPVSERKSTAPNSQPSPGVGSAIHPTFNEAPQQSGASEPNAAPESITREPASENREAASASP